MITLAAAMYPKKFKAGEKIINYGDVGAEYFVLVFKRFDRLVFRLLKF